MHTGQFAHVCTLKSMRRWQGLDGPFHTPIHSGELSGPFAAARSAAGAQSGVMKPCARSRAWVPSSSGPSDSGPAADATRGGRGIFTSLGFQGRPEHPSHQAGGLVP